jgi:hypothetical protein
MASISIPDNGSLNDIKSDNFFYITVDPNEMIQSKSWGYPCQRLLN